MCLWGLEIRIACSRAALSGSGSGECLLLLGCQRDLAVALDDALGIGARLATRMDRADDQAVSAVVNDRRREGEPAAHVAERVVADDGNVTQALLDIAGRLGELCADPFDIFA